MNRKNLLSIFWISFLVSQLVIGAAGYFLIVPKPEGVVELPVWIFYILAITNGGIAIYLAGLASEKGMIGSEGSSKLSLYLLSWAMGESIVCVGLLLLFLGLGIQHYLSFVGSGLILHGFHYPRL